jgi:hypothetical protein
MPPDIRNLAVHLEETRAEGGRGDAGGPLRKAALAGLAVTNRGRLNARLGGLANEEVVGLDGLR